jgi:hypothetical protein
MAARPLPVVQGRQLFARSAANVGRHFGKTLPDLGAGGPHVRLADEVAQACRVFAR